MISRSGNKNFLAAHYDWIVLAVGAIVLAVGAILYLLALGEDPDAAAAETAAQLTRRSSAKSGVEPVDMTALKGALDLCKSPKTLSESDLTDKSANFLASEKRILCINEKCGKAMPEIFNEQGGVVCPFCQSTQAVAKAVVVLDADGDGLPDAWEKKYGLNVNDASDANADLDKDDFTNLEEYEAKTDPTDRNDHPDYLDSLRIVLPLKETVLPFVFRKANKIPAGWRCEFFDPARRDDYGRKGATLTAVVGEEIADTGFVLKAFTEKSAKKAIKGGEGLTKTVDASEAVVERKSDGKQITLVVQQGKQVKLAPVDVQATLSYERGQVKTFTVVIGTEIVLSGTKYKVVEIKSFGKGAKVTVENIVTGKLRTLEALEQ